MPWTHLLPPDTRAVGTGDPANDEDANVDALVAMGSGFNVLNPLLSGGADPLGVLDSWPAFQAAASGLTGSIGGTITVPPGIYLVSAPVVAVNVLNIVVQGGGMWATTIKYTGTGDCFRIYGTNVFNSPASCAVFDLTIDGTSAGAGSAGLHIGDVRAAELRCAVQNFSGTASMGVHLDNQTAWTEETHGYLWLSNNTQNLVFDVSAPAGTTVAAGSNGGTISAIATWGGTFGGSGVLDVASTSGYPTSGTLNVAASGATTAVVTYTAITAGSFTGCAYVSGSPAGTVATGAVVGLVTSTNSFGYSDLTVELLAKVGQDGVVLQNGAQLYNSRLSLKANFQGSASAQSNAVLRITGSIPAGHSIGGASRIQSCRLDIMAECSSALGSNPPQTIAFGTLSSNALLGCTGVMDFAQGSLAFTASNWTPLGASGFSYDGVIRGDFNLNSASVGLGSAYSYICQGARGFGKALLNPANGNMQVDNGDFFNATLTGNITITLNPGGAAALGAAQRKTILLKQAAAGGPFTVAWPSTGSPSVTNCTVIWLTPGGTPPVMPAGAGATMEVTLDTYDGATWFGQAYSTGPLGQQAEPASFAPSNPASTISLTQVMMGLGSACAYTPTGSGTVLVTITGYCRSQTGQVPVTVGARSGTGTAPANGVAVTGTRIGPAADPTPSGSGAGSWTACPFTAILALTAGTPYWFDMALATSNASDAASVANMSMSFAELP